MTLPTANAVLHHFLRQTFDILKQAGAFPEPKAPPMAAGYAKALAAQRAAKEKT